MSLAPVLLQEEVMHTIHSHFRAPSYGQGCRWSLQWASTLCGTFQALSVDAELFGVMVSPESTNYRSCTWFIAVCPNTILLLSKAPTPCVHVYAEHFKSMYAQSIDGAGRSVDHFNFKSCTRASPPLSYVYRGHELCYRGGCLGTRSTRDPALVRDPYRTFWWQCIKTWFRWRPELQFPSPLYYEAAHVYSLKAWLSLVWMQPNCSDRHYL